MKLSCQEHLVPGKIFLEKVDWLEKNHFHGIELWGFGLKDRIIEIEAALGSKNIEISAICGGYDGDLFSSDVLSMQKAISGIKELIELGSRLHSPGLIIVPSFGRTEIAGVLSPYPQTTDEMIEKLTKALKEIVLFAEEHKIRLYLEAINRYECPAFNQIGDISKICSMLNSSALSVLADTYHMNMEEKSIEKALKENGRMLGYIHLADSNRLIPGYGNLNFEQIIQALYDISFKGFLSFECFIDNPQKELLIARDHILRIMNQLQENVCH